MLVYSLLVRHNTITVSSSLSRTRVCSSYTSKVWNKHCPRWHDYCLDRYYYCKGSCCFFLHLDRLRYINHNRPCSNSGKSVRGASLSRISCLGDLWSLTCKVSAGHANATGGFLVKLFLPVRLLYHEERRLIVGTTKNPLRSLLVYNVRKTVFRCVFLCDYLLGTEIVSNHLSTKLFIYIIFLKIIKSFSMSNNIIRI